MRILNLALYKFAPIPDPAVRRSELREWLRKNAPTMRGTVIFAPEGVNASVAGPAEETEVLLTHLRSWNGMADTPVKRSWSDRHSFTRMLVKVKNEIIPIGIPGVDPSRETGRRLSPEQLAQWIEEGKEFTLLDTRNRFEVEVGTFEGAVELGLRSFREFPRKLQELPPQSRHKPLVMFCTGGIRCEKASAYAIQAGFPEVHQVDGGILAYFERMGARHFRGECFVFDKRVSLDGGLRPGTTSLCYGCRSTLKAGQTCERCGSLTA